MLGRMLHCGAYKTMTGQGALWGFQTKTGQSGLVRVALFW